MKKKYKKNIPNFMQLQLLWSLYLNHYYEVDPKLTLEDWDHVFDDFLEKPEETLEYWQHLTNYDPPMHQGQEKYDQYDHEWEVKLNKLVEKLPIPKDEHNRSIALAKVDKLKSEVINAN